MDRTMFSLSADLHHRIKAMAEQRKMSMAALIRETLEKASLYSDPKRRVAEPRAVYTALVEKHEEPEEMKRMVISLPDALHERVRANGARRGVSMAAFIRESLEERTRRERPKPRFGAFASGYSDTARQAGEIQYEPRSWR